MKQQQDHHHYNFHVSFGEVVQPQMKLHLKYAQTQLDDYSFVLKIKMKEGIDVKVADSEFKERCKSCYTILTSFVKQIRDFLKPTFTLSYQVDEQYAYIKFTYSNQNDALEFLEICRYIRNTIERSQESESVEISLVSDLSFADLSQSISNAIYNMNLLVDGNAIFKKDTMRLFESLINLKRDDLPELLQKIDVQQILTYLQLLQKGSLELNFDRPNIDVGFPQPNLELPFKFAIYGKLQKFAEQYVDDCIEFEMSGPGLNAKVEFKYSGSIFQLIDNILIIKQ